MDRIEFGFFDAGGGHRAAATALEMSIRAQQRPWEVQLTNLQELLDAIDILRKYAGIRIQDAYNLMLRNGWTLGSPQLMRVLQLAIRIYHRPTVRMLEAHLEETKPDMLVSFVPHFNRALCESLRPRFSRAPFCNDSYRHRRLPAALLDRAPEAIFDLRLGSRGGTGQCNGPF